MKYKRQIFGRFYRTVAIALIAVLIMQVTFPVNNIRVFAAEEPAGVILEQNTSKEETTETVQSSTTGTQVQEEGLPLFEEEMSFSDTLETDAAEITNDDLIFDPSTNTITGSSNVFSDKNVTIPAKIGGVEVLHIADSALAGRGLTSITFEPESKLQTIGAAAFKSNAAITSIELPETVTSIGAYAFEGCSKLSSISIPETVTYIGISAFQSCSALTSINIPADIKTIQSSTFQSSGLTSVTFSEGLEIISNSAFYDSNLIGTLTIPNSVRTIDYRAFYSTDISGVTLGTGITSLDSNAFSSCSNLRTIQFATKRADTIDSLITNAENSNATILFEDTAIIDHYCYDLYDETKEAIFTGYTGESGATIDIPESIVYTEKTYVVTGISDTAFKKNDNIEAVILPSGITTLPDSAFYDADGLKTVDLTKTGITVIPYSAFSSCYLLNTVKLPDSITSIESSAFSNCDKLGAIELPDSITSIGSSAFNDCDGLRAIELPSGITRVENSAFFYCSQLNSVILPEGISSIGSSAFSNCYNLSSIKLPMGITSIENSAFSNTGLTSINIPNSVTSISATAFQGASKLVTINIDLPEDTISGSPWGSTTASVYWNDTIITDEYVYSATRKQLMKYIGGIDDVEDETDNDPTEVVIPTSITDPNTDTVYQIESYAPALFANNTYVAKVTIPEVLTQIPDYFFQNCTNLSEVVFHDKITKIGNYACNNIGISERLVLPNSLEEIGSYGFSANRGITEIVFNPYLKKLGSYAFSSCSGVTGTMFLPNSLESISSYTFNYCSSITGVEIPEKLTSIPYRAFSSCTNLEKVTMGGNITSIGSYAFSSCGKLTSIDLSKSLQIIDSYAFSSCASLESIDIPDAVTTIYSSAFSGCTILQNLELPKSLEYIGSQVFYNTKITQLSIPSTTHTINTDTFSGANYMKTLFVDQVRDTSATSFHNNAPWKATTNGTIQTPVYFKGEAVVVTADITEVAGEYKRKLDIKAFIENEKLNIKSLELPEGLLDEKGQPIAPGSINIGVSDWNETYYVTDNKDYTFIADAGNGVFTSFTFTVDDIGVPSIVSDSTVYITSKMLTDMNALTLVDKAQATATDGVATLMINISEEDLTKVKALTASNTSTTITMTATSGHDTTLIASKTISVMLVTNAKVIIQDQDNNQIFDGVLDLDSKIIVDNNGTATTHTVDIGTAITLPEPAEKTGYTFDKWEVVQADSSLKLTATYEINTYTVRFLTHGGTALADETYDYNTTIEKPADPTRSGYSFVDWYTYDTDAIYHFNTPVTDDITIYAKWVEYTGAEDTITAKHSDKTGTLYQVGTAALIAPTSFVAEVGEKSFSISYDNDWNTNIPETELELEYVTGTSATSVAPTTRGDYSVRVKIGNQIILTKNYKISPAVRAASDMFADYANVSTTYVKDSITFKSDKNYQYSLTEDGTFTDTIAFDAPNDGTISKTVYVKVGDEIYVTELTYCLENIAPTFDVTGVPTTWQKETVTLTVEASDEENGSGLATEPYSFDGGTTWQVEHSYEFKENKQIVIKVKDRAGNIATKTIDKLLVDQNVPTTPEMILSPAVQDEEIWRQSEITIQFDCVVEGDKESPVNYYYKLWSIDGIEPTEGTAIQDGSEITVSDGTWNLYTYAIDTVGNKSQNSVTKKWKSDTVAPVIGEITHDSKMTFLDWILGKESIEFKIPTSDATSGVKEVTYTMTGADEDSADQTGTLEVDTKGVATLVVTANWMGNIDFVATDIAGWNSVTKTITDDNKGIIVENDAPTITFTVPEQVDNAYYTEDTTVEVSVADGKISSGLESVSYQIIKNGVKGEVVTVAGDYEQEILDRHSVEVVLTESGSYKVEVTATDQAGNTVTSTMSETISLDVELPEISEITYNTTKTFLDWILGKESIEIKIPTSDATSGVKQVKYTMIGVGENSEDKTGTLEVDATGVATLVANANWKGHIEFVATDIAGWDSLKATITDDNKGMIIENDAPTITFIVPELVDNSYYTEDTTVEVSVADGKISSGLETVSYQIMKDGVKGEVLTVDGDYEKDILSVHDFTVVLTESGSYLIEVTVTDHAGNTTTSVMEEAIALDVDHPVAPSITTDYKTDTWVNEDVTFVLTHFEGIDDTQSGFSTYQVKVGDADWVDIPEKEYVVSDETNGTIYQFRVVDIAGNEGNESAIYNVKIDKTLPAVAWTEFVAKLDSDTPAWYGKTQVSAEEIATTVGSKNIITYTDNEEAVTELVEGGFLLDTTGKHTITATITDEAGNKSTIEQVVYIELAIDDFKAVMDEIDEHNLEIDQVINAKTTYDKGNSLVQYRLEKNPETKVLVEILQTLYQEAEQEISDNQAILEVKKVLEYLYSDPNVDQATDYWEIMHAITVYDQLTTEQKDMITTNKEYQSLPSLYDELVHRSNIVEKLMKQINAIGQPYDVADQEKIKALQELVNASEWKYILPDEEQDTFSKLGDMLSSVEQVLNRPLTTVEDIKAAKDAYDDLSKNAQDLLGNTITDAYNKMLERLGEEARELELFRNQVKEVQQYPTVDGANALEERYQKLTNKEDIPTNITVVYEALLKDRNASADIVEESNVLDLKNASIKEIQVVVSQYDAITEASTKQMIDNSTDPSLKLLSSTLKELKELEELLNSIDQGNITEEQCKAIEEAVRAFTKFDAISKDLIGSILINQLNEYYSEVLAMLDYINKAKTTNSDVEIIGLVDQVTLPSDSEGAAQTIVKVVMKESTPLVMPKVEGKSTILSVDISLVADMYEDEAQEFLIASEQVQPKEGSSVLVKVRLPQSVSTKDLEIWHIKDSGKRDRIKNFIVYEKDASTYVIFDASSFSHFAFLSATPKPTVTPDYEDLFWDEVSKDLYASNKGDTVTVTITTQGYVPSRILEIAMVCELTIVLKRDGQEDVLIDPYITYIIEKNKYYTFEELAKLYVEYYKAEEEMVVTAKPTDQNEVLEENESVKNLDQPEDEEYDLESTPLPEKDQEEHTTLDGAEPEMQETVEKVTTCNTWWIAIGGAAAVFFFFLLWKRRKDDEEEV